MTNADIVGRLLDKVDLLEKEVKDLLKAQEGKEAQTR